MTCARIREHLPEAVEGNFFLTETDLRHIEQCAGCQNELAQYRLVLRALRNLRTDLLEPAPNFVADVLRGIELAGEKHAIRSLLRGHRAAYLGGIAAATAAGATVAVILAIHSRKSRVHLIKL